MTQTNGEDAPMMLPDPLLPVPRLIPDPFGRTPEEFTERRASIVGGFSPSERVLLYELQCIRLELAALKTQL